MAKQAGPLFFTGTIDGIVFYKLNGQFYMRSKGDYKSGKQMRKDPAFKRTMQNADTFGMASRLVKYWYYRQVPKEVRKHGLFGKLTGLVHRWLQGGKSKEEAKELLITYCQSLAVTPPKTTTPKPAQVSNSEQQPTLNAVLPQNKEQQTSISTKGEFKQPRYLSKWKVKQDGRLHVHKHKAGKMVNSPDTQYKRKTERNNTSFATQHQYSPLPLKRPIFQLDPLSVNENQIDSII